MFSGMPAGPYIYANDLNDVLKKKHASGTYKNLVTQFSDSISVQSFKLMQDLTIANGILGILP